MKYLLNILFLLFLTLSACQNNKNQQSTESIPEAQQNNFFIIDFEQDNTDFSIFKKHFFTDFPHGDPTQGDVVYDQSKWMHDDIFNFQAKSGLSAHLRYREDSSGFDSYRLTSKAFYNLNEDTRKILFVFKGSFPTANGVWPAWWLNGSKEKEWTYQDKVPAFTDELLTRYSGVGQAYNTPSSVNNTDWPSAGEIDIIENINGDNQIHNTIHTCPQMCDSEWNEDGVIINCANARPYDVNPGCSGRTYVFDKAHGTFACLWEKSSVSFYYWPMDILVKENGGPLSDSPNPKLWTGDELKNTVKLLETNEPCSIKYHQDWQCKNCAESTTCKFQNLKMVFNVTLCGLWAGNEFDETDNSVDNCKAYILGEGKDQIDNQFMKIEYVAVRKM